MLSFFYGLALDFFFFFSYLLCTRCDAGLIDGQVKILTGSQSPLHDSAHTAHQLQSQLPASCWVEAPCHSQG